MADISNEIAAIQAGTSGSTVRSAIIEALNKLNSATGEYPPFYSGSYQITPSTQSQNVPVGGYIMARNLTVEAFSQATLISKTASTNGVFSASADGADGYSTFEVSVPFWSGSYSAVPTTSEQTFPVAGYLMTQDFVVASTANTSASLISKTFSENGVFSASADGADGYSEVTISVAAMTGLVSSTFTANGVYSASHYSVAGFNEVTVSIPYYSGSYTLTFPRSSATINHTLPTARRYMMWDLSIQVEGATGGAVWEGTQSEYDALSSYDSSTTYYIYDES